MSTRCNRKPFGRYEGTKQMISSFLMSSNVSSGVECTAESENADAHRTNQDIIRLKRLRIITIPIRLTQRLCRESNARLFGLSSTPPVLSGNLSRWRSLRKRPPRLRCDRSRRHRSRSICANWRRVLMPLHYLLLGDELRRQLAHSPALWFTFGSLAAGHFWKAFQSGYDAMPDKELKQRVRWDVYLLILRAMAMFIMAAHGLAFILVPLMALLLSYFEIWPERALGAVFGDPSRLYEYDPDDPTSSRRRR